MRSFLRLTALAAPLLLTAWAFPGCSQDEGTGGAQMDGASMPEQDRRCMDKGQDGWRRHGQREQDGWRRPPDKGKMEGGLQDVAAVRGRPADGRRGREAAGPPGCTGIPPMPRA